MRFFAYLVNFLLIIIALCLLALSAIAFTTSYGVGSDKLLAGILMLSVSVTALAAATANIRSVSHRARWFLYVPNAALISMLGFLVVFEERAGSPDSFIWFLALIVALLAAVVLVLTKDK
jgi:hypothetical protein